MNGTKNSIAPAPYRQMASEVLAALETDQQDGLSESEAQSRLKQYGPNELIAEASPPAWRRFLHQFADPLVVLLLIATAISAVLWMVERRSALPYEAIAILVLVLLNAILGFVQQSWAESAVAALRAMSANKAAVIRAGKQRLVPASEVVVGDLMVIEEGDTVPADGRLIQSTSLHVTEAALTGESLPVSKDVAPIRNEAELGDRHNMVFSGTAATYGRGKAVVTAVAMQTEMGRIAGMLKRAPQETTPLQTELYKVGRQLGIVVIIIAIVIMATIILVEQVRGTAALFHVLIVGVALAVAAVPEGLPAVVTAVLALGVQRMAGRNAIVRRLAAVETLGSATVIASDKTGTLTRNEMTARVIVTASGRGEISGTGYAPEGAISADGNGFLDGELCVEVLRALTAAERANNALIQHKDHVWTVQGDPTEGALKVAAYKGGLEPEELNARFERIGEIPFSSERKLMTTVHKDAEHAERLIAFTKGAPDVLLARCTHEFTGRGTRPLSSERRSEILQSNESLAGQALRTIGVAERELAGTSIPTQNINEDIEKDLVFLGLIGLIDPPRDEAKQAVARAKSAGIRPMMITGDHPKTASVIAIELGIAADGRVITGKELQHVPHESLPNVIREVSVYARVNPEHKLRIVEALQNDGNIVAMTGDGVNDAPALKAADIGVAMGISGTDVSKQAADIVLTDDNFATIVAAVEEGRAIYANIQKFLRYLLSSNMGEVLTMFLGVLLGNVIGLHGTAEGLFLPLLATQILWINLMTDGAPALALGIDPPNHDVMHRPPRRRKEGVITRQMWIGIVFVACIMACGTLLVLDASLPGGLIEGSGDLLHARTMAFTTLMMFQLFNVLNARSDTQSAFVGLCQNGWLWFAIGFSTMLQIAVIYVPFLQEAFSTTSLRLSDWLTCIMVASSVLWLRELSKLSRRRAVLSE